MILSHKKLFIQLLIYLIDSSNCSDEYLKKLVNDIYPLVFNRDELNRLIVATEQNKNEVESNYKEMIQGRIKNCVINSTSESIKNLYKKEYADFE